MLFSFFIGKYYTEHQIEVKMAALPRAKIAELVTQGIQMEIQRITATCTGDEAKHKAEEYVQSLYK